MSLIGTTIECPACGKPAEIRVVITTHDGTPLAYARHAEHGLFLCDPLAPTEGIASLELGRCDACSTPHLYDDLLEPHQLCPDWTGGDLCADCAKTMTCNGRCPECDPPDPKDT